MACKPLGDWVVAALEQHADGATEAAGRMVAALRERDWEGDDVLADQLEALLTNGVIPDLRPLPVHLDELAGILEGDPMYGGGRVDLATGEVWPAPAVDYAREIGQEDEDESDDPDKWLWVHCEGSRDGYRDMERFIGTVRDPGRTDRLEIAISGRGAFRRFKDVPDSGVRIGAGSLSPSYVSTSIEAVITVSTGIMRGHPGRRER